MKDAITSSLSHRRIIEIIDCPDPTKLAMRESRMEVLKMQRISRALKKKRLKRLSYKRALSTRGLKLVRGISLHRGTR
jgi:hypothetical protein